MLDHSIMIDDMTPAAMRILRDRLDRILAVVDGPNSLAWSNGEATTINQSVQTTDTATNNSSTGGRHGRRPRGGTFMASVMAAMRGRGQRGGLTLAQLRAHLRCTTVALTTALSSGMRQGAIVKSGSRGKYRYAVTIERAKR